MLICSYLNLRWSFTRKLAECYLFHFFTSVLYSLSSKYPLSVLETCVQCLLGGCWFVVVSGYFSNTWSQLPRVEAEQLDNIRDEPGNIFSIKWNSVSPKSVKTLIEVVFSCSNWWGPAHRNNPLQWQPCHHTSVVASSKFRSVSLDANLAFVQVQD